jgi:hypothetical protein
MVTFSQIKSNIGDVTSEQIGKCTKVWDYQNREDYYLVENEAGDFNDDGEMIEYEVRYSEAHGFTCNCKAGQVGFSRITVHPSGVCKHVRWSVAAFLEQEAAMQEMAEAITEKQHALALPAIKLSRVESQLPEWIKNARPSAHMRRAPREV